MNLISLTAEETKNATSPANRFKLNSLISARGWALVAFLTYLLLSPVLKEYDIIATVFVYVLGAYILVLLITTLTFSMRIKNSIRPQTFQPESLQPVNSDYPKEAHAGIPALFVIKLNKIYIPPGFDRKSR